MLETKIAMRLIILFVSLLGGKSFAQDLPEPLSDLDFRPVDFAEAELGRLLFYDPILSGNRSTSCASCHHPAFGTGDGVSLAIGEGGIGMGPERVADPSNMPEARIPRNAPALFNLGAKEFTTLFHDGRVEIDPEFPGGVRTPLGQDMQLGFASVLSAQSMFPVLSLDEMAGHYSENEIARAVRQGMLTGDGGGWNMLALRVADITEYEHAFTAVYPHIDSASDITFPDVSNAIAAFIEYEWRSDSAPYDALLHSQGTVSNQAQIGINLFYGAAGCSGCHSGPLLTDHQFYAMGVPQFGPGKALQFEDHSRDEGRFLVTGNPSDRFAFRTPSLRNVALTSPYGHTGAYAELRVFIAAHSDPIAALAVYDLDYANLPELEVNDTDVLADPAEMRALARAVHVPVVRLTEGDISALLAFLDMLTDPVAETGRLGSPTEVPSGLPVDHP